MLSTQDKGLIQRLKRKHTRAHRCYHGNQGKKIKTSWGLSGSFFLSLLLFWRQLKERRRDTEIRGGGGECSRDGRHKERERERMDWRGQSCVFAVKHISSGFTDKVQHHKHLPLGTEKPPTGTHPFAHSLSRQPTRSVSRSPTLLQLLWGPYSSYILMEGCCFSFSTHKRTRIGC